MEDYVPTMPELLENAKQLNKALDAWKEAALKVKKALEPLQICAQVTKINEHKSNIVTKKLEACVA